MCYGKKLYVKTLYVKKILQIPPDDPNIWCSFEDDVKEFHSSRHQSRNKGIEKEVQNS